MLRFDYDQNKRSLSIAVARGKGTFNTALLYAFTLAISIHLLCFLLFHVTTIKFSYSDQILPPTNVSADLSIPISGAAVVLENVDSRNKHLWLEMKPSTVSAPKLLLSPANTPNEILKESGSSKQFLASLEQDIYGYPLPSLVLPTSYPGVEVGIYGSLSSIGLLNPIEGLNQPIIAHPREVSRQKIIFHVAYDGLSGKLFWFNPVEKNLKKDIRQKSEALLKSLTFKKEVFSPVVDGQIEITYTSIQKH